MKRSSPKNLSEKWRSFQWDVKEVDGHNIAQILEALQSVSEKPKLILAKTTKGKGVSFMEDKVEWHYKSPSDKELKIAVSEIENA